MAVRYIPYYPDPLEGQALLDNFARTSRVLRYRDNGQVVERIQRGMPYYETALQERVGSNADGNLVLRGECTAACAYLRDQGISVDLVYIDPPFASGADYAKKVYLRRNPNAAQALRQAEEQLDMDELAAFEEKMYGDIWNKESYLNWMYENLMAIKSVMSDNASIYVHLDWHIGHYVKVMMDEIFGEDNFINDIIWKRQTSSGFKGKSAMGKNHDSILAYSKDADFIYNTQYLPYSDEYVEQRFCHTEIVNGVERRFKDAFLGTATTKETVERLKQEGRIFHTATGGMRLRVYLDETQGIPLDDVWTDINAVNSQAEERVDYSTQKPEALLERIIKASSDEGMVVADFFGGSGVTAAVAHRLGRRFIHADVNINSVQTTRDRLVATGAQFDILQVRDGVSLFRNPVQTMDKLRTLIPGLRKDESLGKPWAGSIVDTQHGSSPVYLPDLKDSAARLLDLPAVNSLLHEAMPDLPDETKRVIVYYIDIDDRAEVEQFIHEQNDTLIEVELRDLKQVLDDVVCEDEARWQLRRTTGEVFPLWEVVIEQFRSDRVVRKIEEVNLRNQQQALTQQAKGRAKAYVPLTLSEQGLETIEWVSLDCTAPEADSPWHSDAEVKVDKAGCAIVDGRRTDRPWDGCIRSERRPLRMKVRNICGDETIYPIGD